jgi:DNA primase
MAGRINPDDIVSVRERSSIAEVVGEVVTLRNAGSGSLKGLCPFHEEKTPSFHVTPAKGLYYCFSCQAGGDVIGFVQAIDHLTFAEAVEKLAARSGIELRYEASGATPRGQQGQRTRLIELHREAAAFYADQLGGTEAVTGRRFLDERGFDAAAAARFGVGYAPQGWDTLTKHLRQRGFTDIELTVSGVAKEGQRGLIDRFRGRLIWPIRDLSGDVVGFGARKLYDDDPGPKYLNSPESPVYRKSQVLYGVDLAKKSIANQGQAVIVEGYTDVMACHLSGVETAVATCGTAFGDEHVKVLRRLLMDADTFRGEVVFTFDGDAAGQKAALRAFDDDQRFVAQTFVAVEPHGLDPCELRQQYGPDAVRTLVDTRVPLFEFAIRSVLSRYDLNLPEARVSALREAAPLVARIKDVSLRPEYARSLAGWLGMDVAPVRDAIARATASSGSPRQHRPAQQAPVSASAEPPRTPSVPRPPANDRNLAVERELLKVTLQQPALVGTGFDALGPDVWQHPAYSAVALAIMAAGGAGSSPGGDAWPRTVMAAAPDDTVRSLVTELSVEPLRVADTPDERYAAEQLARVRERGITRRIGEIRSRLQRTDPAQQDEYAGVFAELIDLEQQRRRLLDEAMGAT